jgi:hypothetical protein
MASWILPTHQIREMNNFAGAFETRILASGAPGRTSERFADIRWVFFGIWISGNLLQIVETYRDEYQFLAIIDFPSARVDSSLPIVPSYLLMQQFLYLNIPDQQLSLIQEICAILAAVVAKTPCKTQRTPLPPSPDAPKAV